MQKEKKHEIGEMVEKLEAVNPLTEPTNNLDQVSLVVAHDATQPFVFKVYAAHLPES